MNEKKKLLRVPSNDFESMSEEEMMAHSQAEAVACGGMELDNENDEGYSDYV